MQQPRPPAGGQLAGRPAGATWLVYLLATLPAWLLLRAIDQNAVSVPFMDDWQFVSLIEPVRRGDIPWSQLAAPHDEHRLLIPRILILASTLLSHGNYRVQCFITFGVVALFSLALLLLLRRILGTGRSTAWVWLVANTIVFSPIQWHNWLWPMQFCYFLPFTFLALALAGFYSDLATGWRFAICQLCAWAASFSFVQGLLLWPVLLPVLARDRRFGSLRARRLYLLAWLAAAALAAFLYFHGLFQNTADPSYAYLHRGVPPTTSTLRLLREHPLDTLGRMLQFALAMFGNAIARGFPVSSNLRLATRAGALLLVSGIVLWRLLARRGRLEGPAFACAAILLHAFLTAGLVSVGRAWAGPGQPLTPRYTTFGTFCLLSVFLLACLGFAGRNGARASRDLSFVALGALLAVLGVNWTYGLDLMGEWHDVQTTSRAGVHFSQQLPVPFLHLAGGRAKFLKKRIAMLEDLGYWHPPLAKSLRLDQFEVREKLPKEDARITGVRARPGGAVEIRGSARFGRRGQTPDAILITSPGADGAPVIRSLCETRSPPRWQHHAYQRDYEFVDRELHRSYGYFRCRIESAAVPPGPDRRLSLWALDFAHMAVHRVRGKVEWPQAGAPS